MSGHTKMQDTMVDAHNLRSYSLTKSSSSRWSIRPRSIFPNKSSLSTPTVPRIRFLSMVLTWSQRARESFGRSVSFADSNGWTKRSAALPLTDERGTTVTVNEMSLASVLETTTHGRVLGTSAPRAGSRLTHTNEPLPRRPTTFIYVRKFSTYSTRLLSSGAVLLNQPSLQFSLTVLGYPLFQATVQQAAQSSFIRKFFCLLDKIVSE
jgi:hypothetical protein